MNVFKSATGKKKKSPEKVIKLPKRSTLEETKPIKLTSNSNDNLAAMCNFDPTTISSTPPDMYFMQKLRFRMEKV